MKNKVPALYKLWTLQIVHQFGLLLALFYFTEGVGWWLCACAVFMVTQIAGANIGLHRFSAHRSFEVPPFFEGLLICLANLVGQGSSLSWVASHRHHHRTSDSTEDCHSPHHMPIHKIVTGQWQPFSLRKWHVEGVNNHWMHRLFHQHYFLLHASLSAILMGLGIKFFIFLYCVPLAVIFYTSYSVVIGCHKWGYQNFEIADHSRNNALVALLTFGEGWHNNHHAHPSSKNHGIKRFEFDLTGWLLEFLPTRPCNEAIANVSKS